MKLGKIVFAGVVTVGVLVISDLKDRINKLEAEAKEDQKEIDDLREHSWWDVKRAEQAEKTAGGLYRDKCLGVVSGVTPWENRGDWASDHSVSVQEFYDSITKDEDARIKALSEKRLNDHSEEYLQIVAEGNEEPVSPRQARALGEAVAYLPKDSEDVDKLFLL